MLAVLCLCGWCLFVFCALCSTGSPSSSFLSFLLSCEHFPTTFFFCFVELFRQGKGYGEHISDTLLNEFIDVEKKEVHQTQNIGVGNDGRVSGSQVAKARQNFLHLILDKGVLNFQIGQESIEELEVFLCGGLKCVVDNLGQPQDHLGFEGFGIFPFE